MIYFITARSLGFVKIGYAKDVQQRFHTIQVSAPVDLCLERVCEGGKEREAEVQGLFSHLRERGEWFKITQETEDFMADLQTHEWKHRGWHHAARREAMDAAA